MVNRYFIEKFKKDICICILYIYVYMWLFNIYNILIIFNLYE